MKASGSDADGIARCAEEGRTIYRMMSPKTMQEAGFQFPCQDALAASTKHKKIKGEILDEVMHFVAEGLPVQCVQYRVTGSIRDGACSLCLAAFSELQRLTAERSLINRAVLLATEWTA